MIIIECSAKREWEEEQKLMCHQNGGRLAERVDSRSCNEALAAARWIKNLPAHMLIRREEGDSQLGRHFGSLLIHFRDGF